MAQPPDPPSAADELDKKLALLEWSYKEVLDATKHQDDKIGRLLTAIAFLTAAALALANLAQGHVIRALFNVGGSPVPLALYSLSAFLFGVLVTVVLLVTSFATPLRLPGLQQPSRKRPPFYVTDAETSQIYFSEISRTSVDEWRDKWEVAAEELKKERRESLVLEIHNLSVRTSFKYHRTSEAIGFFSFALMLFGLAVLFATFAATSARRLSDIPIIDLTTGQRVAIALLLAGYSLLHLLSRLRYNHQAVTEPYSASPTKAEWVRAKSQVLLILTIPVGIGVVAAGGDHRQATSAVVALTAGLAVLSLLVIHLSAWRIRVARQKAVDKDDKKSDRQKRDARLSDGLGRTVLAMCIVATVATGGVCATWHQVYGFQLLAGILAVFFLVFASIVGPTMTVRQDRREYLERTEKKELGTGGA